MTTSNDKESERTRYFISSAGLYNFVCFILQAHVQSGVISVVSIHLYDMWSPYSGSVSLLLECLTISVSLSTVAFTMEEDDKDKDDSY